jgi:TatD DNase family protein
MIDTHCHLTFPELAGQLDAVIASAHAAGVHRMITIGTTPADAMKARDIAVKYADQGVFFAAGVHPNYGPQVTLADLPRIAELASHERCVAFGEMGVDYHYDDPPPAPQHELFAAQLEMVRYSRLNKPVIIHCRKAVDDTLAIIRASGIPGDQFVFHCFTESVDHCRKVLDLGAMISFTGVVTYKNAPEVRDAFMLVPMDRLMIETDAPFLSPEPHRKVRPNEPKFVSVIGRYLADLRGMDAQQFEQIIDANSERFFRLPATR